MLGFGLSHEQGEIFKLKSMQNKSMELPGCYLNNIYHRKKQQNRLNMFALFFCPVLEGAPAELDCGLLLPYHTLHMFCGPVGLLIHWFNKTLIR